MRGFTGIALAGWLTMLACSIPNDAFQQGDGSTPRADGSSVDGALPPDAATTDKGSDPDARTEPDAPAGCGLGNVRFELVARPGGRANPYCIDSCQSWLGIRAPSGNNLRLPSGLDCYTRCETCTFGPCPDIACGPLPLDNQPIGRSWDGTELVNDTCGEQQHTCLARGCVAAGRYKAVFCAFPNINRDGRGCEPAMPAICVEVPFTLPTPSTGLVVRGELPAVE